MRRGYVETGIDMVPEQDPTSAVPKRASTKTDDYATRVKFAWWYVDGCAGRRTPADAWKHFERIAAYK